MARVLFNLTCCIGPVLFLFAALTGTHIWRIALKAQLHNIINFRCYFSRVNIMMHNRNDYVKSVEGQQLAFNAKDEREIYFTQLKLAWN